MEDRAHEVEQLHLKGWTNRQIAASVGFSARTVGRDLKRIEARHLDRISRRVQEERVHSISVYRHVQTTLWKVLDRLMASEDPKFSTASASVSAARAITDAEKAVSGILGLFAQAAERGTLNVRELFAGIDPAEFENTGDDSPSNGMGDFHTRDPHL
jgi:DNA-binding Lrp family transcriptional regulator